MAKGPGRPTKGGHTKLSLAEAALALMEQKGEAAFSIRGIAQRVDCDPMTVLHHFGSKHGLYRGMAERMESELEDASAGQDWRQRLRHLAVQYRSLARRYPNSFWLLQKFVHSGVADLKQTEMVHRALRDASVPEQLHPAICIGWYASIIGLAMGETSGLIRAFTDEEAAEIGDLDPVQYASLHAALPLYKELSPDHVFASTVQLLIDGIEKLSDHGASN